MGLRQRMGTPGSTAFPSGHLALTPFQDLKDFKSRLPVPGRPHSFSPWVLRPSPGEVFKSLGPEGQAMPRGAFEGAERRQLEREAR